ncbi:MAG: LPS export ABC transporter periplasmic protein LptC [Woeseiaceae bacterium]|jgi:LPS export ABC transporter protein LptC|nr:LPS export ABC transporter periplasmic protein LptC [Woeseiaceae bacterium]
MNAKSVTLYVVLALAAFGSWYLARQEAGEEKSRMPLDPLHRGFYLVDARILGTGPTGELLYEIEAEHAEQVDDESIDFTNVRLDYSPETDVPWSVVADSATIRGDERRVLLSGDVRAVSPASESQPETEIRTEYLELDPDNFVAETEQRVQIRIGERSLTATGMLASLDEDRLELKSNVSGKFLP